MKHSKNIKLVFYINNCKQDQVKFTGRIRNINYNTEDVTIDFEDNAELVFKQIQPIYVEILEKTRILYSFDISINDILVNTGKSVCFGIPCLYVFDIKKKVPNNIIRENALISEDDMEKKFYTNIEHISLSNSYKIKNFYVILPKYVFKDYNYTLR